MSLPSPTSSGHTSRFLDLAALSAVEHMRFTTRYRIEGVYSGRHQSRRQGSVGEFVDYREYADGEDLRRLDWKVLGRTGRAYVRLFQDETNLVCMLALDVSGSMAFAGCRPPVSWNPFTRRPPAAALGKLEYAQYLATAFSHVIARGQDQVGLALLSEQLAELIPPGGTATHLARVYAAIEGIQAHPAPQMAASLRELFERAGRCGVLVVMSDFLQDDLEEVFAALRLFRHRRWEVVALHLVHPDEERLPEGIAFRFAGLENDGDVACSPGEVRREYERRFAAHLQAVRTLALGCNCDYHLVPTSIDYLQTVRRFLVARTG